MTQLELVGVGGVARDLAVIHDERFMLGAWLPEPPRFLTCSEDVALDLQSADDPVKAERLTLGDLARRYLQEASKPRGRNGRPRCNAESIATYQKGLDASRKALVDGRPVAEKPVSKVDYVWAQQAHDAIVEANGGATADKWARLCSAAWRSAEKLGELPAGPWSDLERWGNPPPPVDFEGGWLRSAIDAMERARAEKICPPRWADFFLVCMATGARPWCEVRRLRWRDVDDDRGVLVFAFSKGPHGGKVRRIPLALLEGRGREALERQRSASEWVWPNRTKKGPTHKKVIEKWWPIVRGFAERECGLEVTDQRERKLGLYVAGRHAFATHCANEGLSRDHIAELLGHADPRTSRRYIHLTGSHLVEPARKAAAKLQRKHMDQQETPLVGVVDDRLRRALRTFEDEGGVLVKGDGEPYGEFAIKSWTLPKSNKGRRTPPIEVLCQLATKLKIPLGWLCGEGGDNDHLPVSGGLRVVRG